MAGYFDQEVEEGEHALLVSLFPKARDLTIKEIMKSTPYSSYERNNSYLKTLAKKGVIKEEKIGKTLKYSLIPNNWHSKIAFYLYAKERARIFSQKHKTLALALKELPEEEIDFLAIFGSYAKNLQKKDSDLDLLAIGSYEEKNIKELEKMYNMEINIKKYNISIFKSPDHLFKEVIKDHIIAKGGEDFVKNLLENGNN